MGNRCWFFSLLVVGLLLAGGVACGRERSPRPTSQASPAPTLLMPTAVPAVPTPLPPTVTPSLTAVPVTATPVGTALRDVQFALDVDQDGQLVFPANEFVFGVTRVYVHFIYQDLADVTEVQSKWYLNENLVVSDTLAWDGGETGDYVIWMEDPYGIGKGGWRWELMAEGATLGSGTFTVGGEPRYTNKAWGLSFDPPSSWEIESEAESFVTFSSPDQRRALALRVSPVITGLTEIVAADLAAFQQSHPDAEIVATQDVSMGGERAIAQQLSYTDGESGDQLLYVVSALYDDSICSLWVLGPAEEGAALQRALVAALRSIRFLDNE